LRCAPRTSRTAELWALAATAAMSVMVTMNALAAGVTLPPQRVVSLNLCADQLLMALLPTSRIASITWLSRSEGDPSLLPLAKQIAVNHGSAEEVLRLRPDLVVAGKFTTGTTRSLLRRAGVPLVEIDPANDWNGIRRLTRQVGSAVGESARAEALLSDMDAELAALGHEQPARRIRVIGWGGAGDDVPGRDTLFNTILESAGAVNVAAVEGRGSFDLEQLLLAGPQVLLRGAAYGSAPALRNGVAQHRILREQYAGRMLTYPEAVYGCGVPHAARLARDLAAQLRQIAGVTP
jgi:iron complex transport system substrate-binding protein